MRKCKLNFHRIAKGKIAGKTPCHADSRKNVGVSKKSGEPRNFGRKGMQRLDLINKYSNVFQNKYQKNKHFETTYKYV